MSIHQMSLYLFIEYMISNHCATNYGYFSGMPWTGQDLGHSNSFPQFCFWMRVPEKNTNLWPQRTRQTNKSILCACVCMCYMNIYVYVCIDMYTDVYTVEPVPAISFGSTTTTIFSAGLLFMHVWRAAEALLTSLGTQPRNFFFTFFY